MCYTHTHDTMIHSHGATCFPNAASREAESSRGFLRSYIPVDMDTYIKIYIYIYVLFISLRRALGFTGELQSTWR